MEETKTTYKDFLQPRDAWDALSMKEKAEMIGVAVRNGITNLNDIRDRYNEFAEGGSKEEAVNTDEQYLATMEKVAEDNHQKWGFSNPDEALLHALNDNTYNYRGYYDKYPQSKANADTHWTDEFKTVYHPTFSNESIYSGQKSQYNPLGLPGGFWSGDTFVPMAWQLGANEYKEGGGIHIAPSKKGTFTAAAKKHGKSVQAFASQVLAHPENYSPAMRKKANFARNSRKWKHGLGGNLFGGTSQPTQKMQIGLDVQGWPDYTTEQIIAYGKENERRRKAIQDAYLNFVTESNDATAVANGRPQNQHLVDKAIRGAKANAAWEKGHPNLTAWSYLPSVAAIGTYLSPLGVAGWSGLTASGDAAAATSTGQAITAGLAPLHQAVTSATIAGVPALTWANTGLQSLMVGHGLSEAANGTFTPVTALELTPLAPGIVRTPGIVNNLRPQNIRNYWYIAKPPIGYDGIGNAVERLVRGVASGKPANIDNPWWFNSSSAKKLQDYAYVPDAVQGIEREQYLQQFGEHALEARADAWRMHNLIPQKYNTFTPNPRHPGSFTDVEGIRRLKYIPPQTEGTPQVDFVNSVGGNVGVPEITNLGNGIPDTGTQIKRFGVTTTSDWFDLHPFSREEDRLISRFVKPLWDKHIAAPILNDAKWMKKIADKLKYNDADIKSYLAQNKDDEWAMEMFDPDMFPATGARRKIGNAFETLSNGFKEAARTPEFRFLKPLEDKMINLEAGDITGGKPFLVQYDIPFTTNIRFISEAPEVITEQVPGFVSENLLPQSVFNWKHGVYTEPANINLENNFDFLNTTLTRKSKR